MNWTAALMLLSGALALGAGARALAQSRRQAYFRLRRQAILNGWRAILWGLGLCALAGLLFWPGRGWIQTGLSWVASRPTVNAVSLRAATPTALSSVNEPPRSPEPSKPVSPAGPVSPAPSLTPLVDPPPARSLTPQLPIAQLTLPPGTLTVTPPAEAVIANLRISHLNDCSNHGEAKEVFDLRPRPWYALFDYDGWLPNVLWTSVWVREGVVMHTEALLWDGSTGGCGYANYDNGGGPWAAGHYEVQIFLGARWLGSASFSLSGATPTPAASKTATP